jgi:hypothetical protein
MRIDVSGWSEVIQRWDRGTTRQDVVCSGRRRIQEEGDGEAQILQRMRRALGIENPVGTTCGWSLSSVGRGQRVAAIATQEEYVVGLRGDRNRVSQRARITGESWYGSGVIDAIQMVHNQHRDAWLGNDHHRNGQHYDDDNSTHAVHSKITYCIIDRPVINSQETLMTIGRCPATLPALLARPQGLKLRPVRRHRVLVDRNLHFG